MNKRILLLKKIIIKVYENPIRIYKAGKIILTRGPFFFVNKVRSQFQQSGNLDQINNQYNKWLVSNYPTKEILLSQRNEVKKLNFSPLISVICPTYNTPYEVLKECISSVINQSYENWELCLADDNSVDNKIRNIIKAFAKKDKRIKYIFSKQNGHICKASNLALSIAQGEYIGLLDHDDILWPNALFEVVSKLSQNKTAQLIYSDEDKLSEEGTHTEPFFKPDWSPHYLRTVNYITHFAVLKKDLVDRVGGFREGTEGAQDWDLFLRSTNILKKNEILHIPTILYSWRKSNLSTASEKVSGKVKLYAYANQKKVLEKDLTERGYDGKVVTTGNLGMWRVRYKIIGKPKVSIIIPTKDRYEYISRCLDSLIKKTTYDNFEIIIVDTGSKDEKIWELYKKIIGKLPKTKILKWKKEFNFASVCNFGVEKSIGDYIVLLNNDTQIITPDWIEGMLEFAQLPEVGAVGCKLLYPDYTIQHAGVVLGINGGNMEKGVAGHAFHYMNDSLDIRGMLQGVRDYSAVTAACLMIKKEKYLEVNGQDDLFKIAFNDVDFNLKLMKKGYYNVYNGFVRLIHHESVSVEKPGSGNRDLGQFAKEIKLMHDRWGDLLQNDPFYNKNLTLNFEDFTLVSR